MDDNQFLFYVFFLLKSMAICLQVLVEKETSPGFFSGRSPYLQSIHFQSNKPCIGNIVDIKILKVNDNSLSGEIFN